MFTTTLLYIHPLHQLLLRMKDNSGKDYSELDPKSGIPKQCFRDIGAILVAKGKEATREESDRPTSLPPKRRLPPPRQNTFIKMETSGLNSSTDPEVTRLAKQYFTAMNSLRSALQNRHPGDDTEIASLQCNAKKLMEQIKARKAQLKKVSFQDPPEDTSPKEAKKPRKDAKPNQSSLVSFTSNWWTVAAVVVIAVAAVVKYRD